MRHIHAALGQHPSRSAKRVVTKEGKRVITLRAANPDEAATHLESARKLVPGKRGSALDPITYNRLSVKLVDAYLQQDKRDEAERTLRQSLRYFQRMRVARFVLSDYRERINALRR